MRLITKEIGRKLMHAYELSQETGQSGQQIHCKLFTPWANCTWYITEGWPLNPSGSGEPCDGARFLEAAQCYDAYDWHLFGFCDLGHGPEQAELGYVSLRELLAVKGPFGLRIERDRHFAGTLAEVMARYRGEAA
jgi:hypothetical protein